MRFRNFIILGCAAFSMHCPSFAGESQVRKELCQSCKKTVFHYSRCFDRADYSFFGHFIDEVAIKSALTVFHRAPHGPTPECSSTWTNDLSYNMLLGHMTRLRRDTYDSFLARNRYIAEHATNGFRTPAGRTIRITGKPKREEMVLEFSRVGFSGDGKQALMCTDSIAYLYEYSAGKWKEAGKLVLWIS